MDRLYRQLTEIARNPDYYAHMHVPDTVMGRFEMLSIVMVLFFRRADGGGPALKQLSQDVVDAFFEDMDHSLRELGIGDHSVPKRMKRLARMFYGRAKSVGTALNEGDADELARALCRNMYPQDRKPEADGQMVGAGDLTTLAEAVMRMEADFSGFNEADLLAGVLFRDNESISQERRTHD
ncbi:ubiquinol-cytochrome C chaperone family protein [Nitratireductor sp. XY-223]|uniref:ubiquinol-cytochrome C chaperone family protein n=1 Tax=Nitratireductor sp. XY-223 TaxID=2561926 RepID=UPI001FF01368|nr:ubiquinol-cytochrome C chaperone family protein [Nitratireductor sp. XY-223]